MLRSSTARLSGNNAFFDILVKDDVRRVTFELFPDKAPMAVENFLKLCTGEMVIKREPTHTGLATNPQFRDQFKAQLHYKNSRFHRIVPKFIVQGGDIVGHSGENQLSIYGRTFEAPEETKASIFDKRGLLGTAVSAPNMNGSQFFILTANEAPHLNKTCINFGRVASGMDVIDSIEAAPLMGMGRPAFDIRIVNCGVL